jgi:cell division protein FtsN
MSKDYKSAGKVGAGKSGVGSLLIGVLIGLLLGLAVALATAWYINKMPSPFINRGAAPEKSDAAKTTAPDAANVTAQPADTKPRFDFYKILPGSEEPITDQQLEESQQNPSTGPGREAFFLQVGAFQDAADADNRKAQLALLGVEATVQTMTYPDKGLWHRVRAGPYTNIDELNNARDVLKQNGIATTLIRVREASSDNPPEDK